MKRISNIKNYNIFCHLLVIIGYLLLTLILTYPLVLNINTKVPGGSDAFQNLWNFWWVKKSVIDLGTSPYYTNYIYYPTGTSLALHTLSLFNSLLSIPLQYIFGLVTIYNILFIFSYVMSGYGTYLLVYYLTKDRKASFISGLMFAFCIYRSAHGFNGHLNLISTEWIPFYVLFLIKTFHEDDLKNAIIAAFFLFLVSLCSWIYMGFLLIFTAFFLICQFWFNPKDNIEFLKRFIVLIFLFSVMVSTFFYPLLIELSSGSYISYGLSFPTTFSTDLLSFFIPHPLQSLFGNYTRGLYSNFKGNIGEQSGYIGYSVLSLVIFYFLSKEVAFRWLFKKIMKLREMRKNRIMRIKIVTIIIMLIITFYMFFGIDVIVSVILLSYTSLLVMLYYLIKEKRISFWFLSSIFFFIMSLGPFLHVSGNAEFGKMDITIAFPYLILYLLPLFSVFGEPSRFSIMLMLSLTIICGFSLRDIFNRIENKEKFAILISLLIIFEYLVIPYPLSNAQVPPFYNEISKDVEDYTILEIPIPCHVHYHRYMYYQTTHKKKIVGGYISRTPEHVPEFIENTPLIQQLKHPRLIKQVPNSEGDGVLIIKNAYMRPNGNFSVLLKNFFDSMQHSFLTDDGCIYNLNSTQNGSWITNLDQTYAQGDIINQNITKIGHSVLDYYNIKYIIVHKKYLDPDELRIILELINETLHKPVPAYIDDELIVYNVSKTNKKHPFATLGRGWYLKERFGDPPRRWIRDNATLYIIIHEPMTVSISFNTRSYKKNRTLYIYTNGKFHTSYNIDVNGSLVIMKMSVYPGVNTIDFYTKDGCEENVVQCISMVDDNRRCVSIEFQNISIEYAKIVY